jgi:hypothetical protein
MVRAGEAPPKYRFRRQKGGLSDADGLIEVMAFAAIP